MITKNLTYQAPDEQTVTQEWCFHISKAELAEQMLVRGDGLQESLQKIIEEKRAEVIIPEFRKILVLAVGKKKDIGNGRTILDKSDLVQSEFLYGGAYDSLFMEILTQPDSGAQFINSLLPKDLIDEAGKTTESEINELVAKAAQASQGARDTTVVELPQTSLEKVVQEVQEDQLSEDDLRAMLSDDGGAKPAEPEDDRPAWLKEMRLPTKDELKKMSKPELQAAMRLKSEGKLNRANAPT